MQTTSDPASLFIICGSARLASDNLTRVGTGHHRAEMRGLAIHPSGVRIFQHSGGSFSTAANKFHFHPLDPCREVAVRDEPGQ